MGYFYTTQLVTRLQAGASLNGVSLTMHLMSRSPVIDDNDARVALRGVTTFASLTALAGWEEVSTTGYVPMATTTPVISVGANRYVQLNTTLLQWTGLADSQVEAVVYCVDGAAIGLAAGQVVLFGSTTPFGEKTVFRSGDGVSARIDTTVSARWLFGYAIDATPTVTSVVEGTTIIQQGSPVFEVSHVHHVWLYPQRANLIANPSFEGGVTHWQSSGTAISRYNNTEGPSTWVGGSYSSVGSGVPNSGILNPAQRLYVKSAPFFPRGETLTFQLSALGEGVLRVAVAYYPRDYSEYAADWGLKDSLAFEEWPLSYNWTQIKGIRRMSDGYEAALLIEVRPPTAGLNSVLYLDQVMVEEGSLLDWDYFDGDTTYGAEDDYTWYGNTTVSAKRGKSYSLYYNNRRAIAGRLFGRRLDDTAQYTSYDEQLDSLVSHWTPAGAVVMPHWDVLAENDMRLLPADRSATTLPVTIWPEQVQPFSIYSSTFPTTTTGVIQVIGEGAYPVTGGWVVIAGTAYAVTVAPRLYDTLPTQQGRDAARAALYDTTLPQTINISWATPTTGGFTLYLYRGTAASPLSFAFLSLPVSAFAGTGVGTGTANNNVLAVAPVPETGVASGVADNAAVSVPAPAGAAAATGVANNNTLIIAPTPAEGVASGVAADSAVNRTTTATDAAATGVANNAVAQANITPFLAGIGAESNSGTYELQTTTNTPPLPDGWRADDIFLAVFTTLATVTPPAGWSVAMQYGCNKVFYKRAVGGDTAPTFTLSSSATAYAQVLIIRGGLITSGWPFWGGWAVTSGITQTPGFPDANYTKATNAGIILIGAGMDTHSTWGMNIGSPGPGGWTASAATTGPTTYAVSPWYGAWNINNTPARRVIVQASKATPGVCEFPKNESLLDAAEMFMITLVLWNGITPLATLATATGAAYVATAVIT